MNQGKTYYICLVNTSLMLKGLKIIWKLISWLLKALLFVIIVLVFIFTIKYITAPVYIFPEPKPFSGEELFNPYEGIDSNYWRKGNFQIQSAAWLGITDGRVNTNEFSLSDYDRSNGIPGVSSLFFAYQEPEPVSHPPEGILGTALCALKCHTMALINCRCFPASH